ncbi:MAG: CHAT domain-containing protein [Acidobacteria bacterium]|nr:CHAT domain-containing protein [Acidobacteriota bacterium]
METTIEDQVRSLNQQVAALQRSGDIEQGYQLAEQTFRLAREKLPSGSYLLAQSARNLAIMNQMRGDEQETPKAFWLAFELYDVALKHARSGRIRLHESGRLREARDVAATELNAARALVQTGQLFGANRVRDLLESGIALAEIHFEIGELDDGARLLAELERSARSDPNDPLWVRTLQLHGRLAREQGSLAEAKRIYAEVLEAAQSGGAPPLFVASCHNNLGFACKALGEVGRAEACFREAVELIRNSGETQDRQNCAAFLANLADLYSGIGQLDRAVEQQREALRIDRAVREPADLTYALHRFNLGIYLAQRGNREEAFELIADASAILARDINPRSPRFAKHYQNAATALVQSGHFKEAESSAVFALETVRETLGEKTAAFADTLRVLGWVYIRRGKYGQAEGALRKARAITRELLPLDHPQHLEILENLFVALAGRGQSGQPFAVLKELHDIESARLDPCLRLGADADRLQFLAALQENTARAVSFVLEQLPDDSAAAGWLYDLVLRRKGLAAEALMTQRESILADRYPGLREPLEKLRSLRALAGRMMLDRSYDVNVDEYQQRLGALRAEADEIERRLSREIPETGLQQRLLAAGTAAVASALPADTVLLEFVQYREFRFGANEQKGEPRFGPLSYAAFVLRAGQPASLRLVRLGAAAAIDERIAGHRAWITGDDSSRGSTEADTRLAFSGIIDGLSTLLKRRRTGGARKRGQALRALILDPLFPSGVPPGKLFIAPDGDLCWLPFECLFDDHGPLIERTAISYLTCGRDALSFGAASTVPPSDSLVVADPDYELAQAAAACAPGGYHSYDMQKKAPLFSPLEGTRTEGAAVAGLLGVKPSMGADATESLIKDSRSPRVLHLASHGFFFEAAGGVADTGGIGRIRYSEDPMLRSGLALAGANSFLRGRSLPEAAEDGILTSRDVASLDLRGAKLVVLSACNTGLGALRQGEGVFGLRRAFWLAGARALIVSLWKVADRETSEFMTYLYEHLVNHGMGPADALRSAQRRMRTRHADPYYWAAFVFIGDPTSQVR